MLLGVGGGRYAASRLRTGRGAAAASFPRRHRRGDDPHRGGTDPSPPDPSRGRGGAAAALLASPRRERGPLAAESPRTRRPFASAALPAPPAGSASAFAVRAREDREGHVETFRAWAASRIGPDGLAMNPASPVQLSTFLFGGAENSKTKETTERARVFKTPRADVPDNAMEAYREREARMREFREEMEWYAGGRGSDAPEKDEFDLMKVVELKLLCKEYGLKVSGKKAELQQRLRGHFQLMNDPAASGGGDVDDYDAMTVKDLRDACAARSLPSVGKKKAALIKELREDDSSIREISAEYMSQHDQADSPVRYPKISKLLEEAVSSSGPGENDVLKRIMADLRAKNAEEPKYVDVTITSLGMEPDEFASDGAPSATADVLRKLAGNPFADPPNYGKAYDFFGGGEDGHDACVAFFSLAAIRSREPQVNS